MDDLVSLCVAFLGFLAALYGAGWALGYLVGLWAAIVAPDEWD